MCHRQASRAVLVAEVLADSLWRPWWRLPLCWRKAHSLAPFSPRGSLPLQLASSAPKDRDRTLTHSSTHAHRTLAPPPVVFDLKQQFLLQP